MVREETTGRELARQDLKRVLGRGFSIAASLGLIIGLGILRTPGEIAMTLKEPVIYMSLWVGGGVLMLLSLLVTAEMIESIVPRRRSATLCCLTACR